jgi:1,2-dihydroxy-3-keto-5-methylthiopentene dioxygenase
MAVIKIPERQQTIAGTEDVAKFLSTYGITYEQWESTPRVSSEASAEAVLEAYADKVDELRRKGGYTTADVIQVTPATPNLDTMLAKFNREHWHDEDEVRFIVEGRGLFHISPPGGPVFAIEVVAGDMISVPRGTHHWFDLCTERRIRAIRLFQDVSGWTPRYTDSGVDANFQPLCFGPSFVRAEDSRSAM